MERLFVEKKPEFQSQSLVKELQENLKINSIQGVKVVIRYDVGNIPSLEPFLPVLAEANIDHCTVGEYPTTEAMVIGVRPLDGQYDVRAAFAEECIKMTQPSLEPVVKSATFYLFTGTISPEDRVKMEKYLVNPVESSLCDIAEKSTYRSVGEIPTAVETVTGFTALSPQGLADYGKEQGFAMSLGDLTMIQEYFMGEKREPTITELKVIDTYWSDHCRHTTFMTELGEVAISDPLLQKAFDQYLALREELGVKKPICLMDMATIGAKHLKSRGLLEDLDESEEINACSIKLEVDGKPWLLMFKNETHNHPTEIEPFGGAATCLGGAIRDPLSGRSYVFGAMRVTGAADPRVDFSQTLEGKLPQKVITTKAAHGYSSYGNQIGLATGGVYELYHPDYVTKRMEVGAVLGACPAENVVRIRPATGDVILLLGGRTGRDGIGGATGSSKVQTTQSTTQNASEVQKGNPIEERKIQRLFRNPKATTLIKKCNDFGAGGVCVAIGELADSLSIDLNKVPKKYEGLDGTELAISESQERMAVVIAPADVTAFMALCGEENIEVTPVAEVTDSGYLTMTWNGKDIFHVKRAFLDTNGATAKTNVVVTAPVYDFFQDKAPTDMNALLQQLSSLESCSQKGLSEQFDSSIGSATVLSPFGGVHRITPPDGMALKLPMLPRENTTTALMSYGCIPELGKQSPFHAGVYSVVEAVSKLVAMGGDYRKSRLSNQEYFQRMVDETAFGKPVAALLGVIQGQTELGVASIGGKDSMSGSFGELTVPPTMITFAVSHESSEHILSPELKAVGNAVYLVPVKVDKDFIPDYEDLKAKYTMVYDEKKNIVSAKTVGFGGVLTTLAKMILGNGISVEVSGTFPERNWGGILVEVKDSASIKALEALGCVLVGKTVSGTVTTLPTGETLSLEEMMSAYTNTLESVFPSKTASKATVETVSYDKRSSYKAKTSVAKPKVFIPVFPGTNCEYDTATAFETVGASCESLVFRNGSPQEITASLEAFSKAIASAQILMLPGGFSASDQPDGSAKFITALLRSPSIKEEVTKLLEKRDGLILGICNGFQALVKVGLLPKGEICPLEEGMPTLTYNEIGRHISCMVETRVASVQSPWLQHCSVGDIHSIAMSHGEGRFLAEEALVKHLLAQGQIATQYVDPQGSATMGSPYNPNGSTLAIEGITSPDGRIFGKMGHSERFAKDLYQNIKGNLYQPIFQGGVDYFK